MGKPGSSDAIRSVIEFVSIRRAFRFAVKDQVDYYKQRETEAEKDRDKRKKSVIIEDICSSRVIVILVHFVLHHQFVSITFVLPSAAPLQCACVPS